MTDEAPRYISHRHDFRDHKSVNHKQEEWVSRTDPTVHTQTNESFFSVCHRGRRIGREGRGPEATRGR